MQGWHVARVVYGNKDSGYGGSLSFRRPLDPNSKKIRNQWRDFPSGEMVSSD